MPQTKLQRMSRHACVALVWVFTVWLGKGAIDHISAAYFRACDHATGGFGCLPIGNEIELLFYSVLISATALAMGINASMLRCLPNEPS
jgi:hypothetical protein